MKDLEAIVRREIDIFNSGDLDVADEVIADDYLGTTPRYPSR